MSHTKACLPNCYSLLPLLGFASFELLDDLGELLGKSLNLAMTADDAMGLLWLLENIQKKAQITKREEDNEGL